MLLNLAFPTPEAAAALALTLAGAVSSAGAGGASTISRTQREMREASSSGQLVTMTTESVTQISVLRNQHQDVRRQLEESERSISGTSALLPDDKVHRQLDDLYEENSKLIEEIAQLNGTSKHAV